MEYRDPQWNENGTINCEIHHPLFGWIPFTADPNDVERHGRELFAAIKAAGKIKAYEPPTDDEIAEIVRAHRNDFLRATDWTQLPDVPENTRTRWAAYRKALRDIPDQPGFPKSVNWPEPPI